MKPSLLVVLLSLAVSPLTSAIAQVPSDDMPQIAVGAYHLARNGVSARSPKPLPMMITSHDQGHTWSFVNTLDGQPMETFRGLTFGVSCNTNVCVSIGEGMGKGVLTSFDKGNTWLQVNEISEWPQSYIDVLSSVSCNQDGCAAAGMYFNSNGTVPLLLESDASGKKWRAVSNFTNAPQFESATLPLANCNAKGCLAAGYYQQGNLRHPLVLRKPENTSTWNFVNNINGVNGVSGVDLKSISCADHLCILGGTHYKYESDQALILASYDAGASWNVRPIHGLQEEQQRGNVIRSVNCTEDRCIAVGQYGTELSFFPLIAVGDNKNKEFYRNSNIANIPADLVSGDLKSVSCSGNSCVAVGYYGVEKGFNFHPLLLVSEDKGNHWRFVNDIAGLINNDLIFESVSCKGDTCSVGGLYNDNGSGLPPPVVVSNDRGKTWHLIQQFSNLPKNLYSAEVFALMDSTNVLVLGAA